MIYQVAPGTFINADGLRNPGVEEFSRELASTEMPKNKVIVASVVGKKPSEFILLAKILENYVDGFEANLTCPNVEGQMIGKYPQLTYDVLSAFRQATKKQIFAKLTANSDIGEIAKVAIAAGCDGIVAINSLAHGTYYIDGHPVLTNRVGGISGKGIASLSINCVREVSLRTNKKILIIGEGGISNARDALSHFSAGADGIGIGVAFAGMSKRDIGKYLPALIYDIENDGRTDTASLYLKQVDTTYHKIKIRERIDLSDDLKIIKTDTSINAQPGQYIVAWIPDVGEKPFSIMDTDPLTLGILTKGCFTKAINSLDMGDSFYYKGPYGNGVDVPQNSNVVLVGGGIGVAGLFFLAKQFSSKAHITCFLGAKDMEHLVCLSELAKYSSVDVITENGSSGKKGTVLDLFEKPLPSESYFFNCGPREMIEAVFPLELKISGAEQVFSASDYMTRCSIGICGSCADKYGRRTCVEGPFMHEK
jgi:dihydroorotate dehydrogenase (NAD+) catalytic subunit